jgi:signal transduction histidine kinase
MGGIELNPEDIDLNEFVKNEFQILETLAARKSIKLVCEIEANTTIRADRNMLNSIFQSLINNSIKFSYPDSQVRITAHSENDFVKITVKDQGVGINSENLEKLFRIDKNYTTVGTASEKGTGLGLILCKEFVNLHHGNISINSKLGEGTEVTFRLPKVN